MPPTLLGVAGWPVAHSRSPEIHTAALREMGLDWRYLRLPLPPELFTETARSLVASGFRGINVTIPHKVAAYELADELTPAAAAIGAANTLTYSEEGIEADNTDAGGFLDALESDPAGLRCLVLGAGGSARAVAWALREAGAGQVSVWNRTSSKARSLVEDLGLRHLERPEPSDLIVNCTSVGLDPRVGEGEALAALSLSGIEPPEILCDLVYRVGATPLAAWAEQGGARLVPGLEVLVRQGARSLTRWTGRDVPLGAMQTAAQAG
jgi:shikimate dehydrogenase